MVESSYRKGKVVYDMNKIEQFIKEQDRIILEDREKTLIALGLTEKEYVPDDADQIYSYEYPQYDYVNGKEKYYREVAIKITDEEYALILSKVRQVEEIRARQNLSNEEQNVPNNIIKKWIPVFKKTDNKGWSKTAKSIRTTYYILYGLAVLVSFIISITKQIPVVPFVVLGGLIEGVIIEGFASILDYLAELTSIARNGFKYTETNNQTNK